MDTGHGGRFEELDVLRGAAALCVVLSHYASHCARFLGEAPFGVALDTMYGFYAVQLFFMISGFVIYYTLERSASWKDFAFSRVSRLYPAYWTALTLMVLVQQVVFGKPLWVGGYVVNLTMLQEFVGFGNLDNVFWSLTVELAFYAIMGLLFALGLLPRIEVVAAMWLLVAVLWSLMDQYLGIALPAMLSRVLILRHVPFFVAGIAFYLAARKRPTRGRLALLVVSLGAAGLIDGFWDAEVADVEWRAVLRRLAVAGALFGVFALAVIGWLRFSIAPLTLWLGTISYCLYLSHRNLGYATLFRLHEAGLAVWLSFLLTLAGALLLATVLTYGVERPALAALRDWWRGRRAILFSHDAR
jgi:peptidoglycan/LPS O-acetylase OafA/YrhL